jgi:hypothetical protein
MQRRILTPENIQQIVNSTRDEENLGVRLPYPPPIKPTETKKNMTKHAWNQLNSRLPVFACSQCQGVKVQDYQGKFHYFYLGGTQHC